MAHPLHPRALQCARGAYRHKAEELPDVEAIAPAQIGCAAIPAKLAVKRHRARKAGVIGHRSRTARRKRHRRRTASHRGHIDPERRVRSTPGVNTGRGHVIAAAVVPVCKLLHRLVRHRRWTTYEHISKTLICTAKYVEPHDEAPFRQSIDKSYRKRRCPSVT